MLTGHFFHRSNAAWLEYHLKVLLVSLLFLQHADIPRGELILIYLIVLHVLNSKSFVPPRWFLCDLLRIIINMVITFLLFCDLFLIGGLGTG